jgi:hypothetical protein
MVAKGTENSRKKLSCSSSLTGHAQYKYNRKKVLRALMKILSNLAPGIYVGQLNLNLNFILYMTKENYKLQKRIMLCKKMKINTKYFMERTVKCLLKSITEKRYV